MARVTFLDKEQVSEEFQDMFQIVEARGGKILNLFKTVAHCPKIGPEFLRLGNSILLKGNLPDRLRELAIIRVGILADAKYETTQHIPIGRNAGLTNDQIETLADWHESPYFAPEERAVLQYTDEVAQNIRTSDDTFIAIREFLSQEQAVELTIVIGYYGMVSRLLESLQIELEDE